VKHASIFIGRRTTHEAREGSIWFLVTLLRPLAEHPSGFNHPVFFFYIFLAVSFSFIFIFLLFLDRILFVCFSLRHACIFAFTLSGFKT
jgi:hypothetical protein